MLLWLVLLLLHRSNDQSYGTTNEATSCCCCCSLSSTGEASKRTFVPRLPVGLLLVTGPRRLVREFGVAVYESRGVALYLVLVLVIVSSRCRWCGCVYDAGEPSAQQHDETMTSSCTVQANSPARQEASHLPLSFPEGLSSRSDLFGSQPMSLPCRSLMGLTGVLLGGNECASAARIPRLLVWVVVWPSRSSYNDSKGTTLIYVQLFYGCRA
jgi:hypothetical protein